MPSDPTGPSDVSIVSADSADAGAPPTDLRPPVAHLPTPTGGSFDAFFVEQLPRLNRIALLILGSAEAAEEVVQEAFIRVYRRWDRLDNPAAFARVCVVNACRDQLRRRGRWRTREPLVAAAGHVDPPDGPDDHLLAVVRRLPERQRSAIVLRYYEDLAPAEVAAALGLSPSATKSLLHRALESIRAEVKP